MSGMFAGERMSYAGIAFMQEVIVGAIDAKTFHSLAGLVKELGFWTLEQDEVNQDTDSKPASQSPHLTNRQQPSCGNPAGPLRAGSAEASQANSDGTHDSVITSELQVKIDRSRAIYAPAC